MFELITPLSYWVLTVLWMIILWLYLNHLRQSKIAGKAVTILLIILAIDAFRTLFESAYFGLYFNSFYGFLPKSIHDVLSRPELLIIPKLANIVAGLLVLSLLLRHWLPREVKNRKADEEKLKLSASVFSHAREGIMFTDASGIIIDVNEMFTEITGYQRGEAIGQNPRILQSGSHDERFYSEMWESVKGKGYWQGENWNRRKNGQVFAESLTISAVHDDQGQLQHYVGLFTDITKVKKHQKQLEYAANYDALTKLPNRLLLGDRMRQAMRQSDRRKTSIAIAFLDLDDFKVINDKHGHAIGDQFLVHITAQMKDVLRTGDTLARLGGDEFAAILVDIDQPSDCESLLQRLIMAISKPVVIHDKTLSVSASIGIALYPQDKVDAERLLRHADQAMYAAKQKGKGQYHFFDVNANNRMVNRQDTLNRVRQALREDELLLHYQPKVNLRTGDMIGVEALIRWQHPDQGLLYPGAFLGAIQDDALSVEVGDWVIGEALRQADQWKAGGLNLPISVNVGAMQLQSDDFILKLTNALAQHPGLEAASLQLEILESSAVKDINQVSNTIKDCVGIGIDCALDDFGTGYSSLTYLKMLPAQILKIDQSFVRDMLEDADDKAIVSAVIGLASSFDRQVIAEGVETEEHARELLQMNCELAQGYWISYPMAAQRIPSWINDWSKRKTPFKEAV